MKKINKYDLNILFGQSVLEKNLPRKIYAAQRFGKERGGGTRSLLRGKGNLHFRNLTNLTDANYKLNKIIPE